MAEHEVAGGDVREDSVHAAAVAAPLIVQLHASRSNLQRQLFQHDFGGLCLILLALVPVLRGISHDEVCTDNMSHAKTAADGVKGERHPA